MRKPRGKARVHPRQKLLLSGLLAELMARFAGLPNDQIDGAIKEAQKTIVETLGLDRSSLYQAEPGGSGLFITQYYQKPGWAPLPKTVDAAVLLPWSCARVMAGELISFTRLEELPPEAARDLDTFRAHGPMSCVAIPLFADRNVFGCLTFASLRAERVWREEEICEMKLIAEVIGNVLGRQRAEIRADQLRAEIAHITRTELLGELAAALAHEITQPLAAILTNAQAARRFSAQGGLDPDELQSILGDIIRDGKRAGAIIHNLRSMLSKEPVARELCSLDQILQEVVEFMHPEFLGNNIQVSQLIPDNLPRVKAVRVQLQQVVMNLLVNAIQAMHETPDELRAIELAIEVVNGALRTSVRDHGCGIAPEQIHRVFDPFFTTKAAGLGMGLPICRRLIEANAGIIEARNHPQRGTVVAFSLPAVTG